MENINKNSSLNKGRQSNMRQPAKRRQINSKAQSRRLMRADRDYYDYNLLAVVILLTCFGLIMLYSTSAYEALIESNDDMSYFRKQAVISALALLLAMIASQFDYHYAAKLSIPIYLVSLVMLIATRFIGREVNGAKRWIYFGPISFQPAEFAKVAIILVIPMLIVKAGKRITTRKRFLTILAYGVVSAFCTYFFTENLSTASIILGISLILLFISYPDWKPFAKWGGIAAVLLLIALIIILNMSGSGGSFRIRRIQVWLHPETFKDEGGYQVIQGLYAIGSGGFFGKGLGHSAQKLGALPEAQNDMIFSIICEELGVFGAILVILLFVFMLYRLFFIAQNAPDLLGALIVSGIFVHISLQLVLNIMVVTNMIPTTGITLPFVSYGGTSILFLMAEMALALSVSKQIRFNP